MRVPAFCLLMLLALAPVPAWAQTCTFTVTNVNFGDVDTLSGGAVDATGTINVTCSTALLTNIRVCLNLNAGSGGAVSGVRQMRNPANAALNYNLFQDPARSIPWGSREQPSLGNAAELTFTQLLGSVSQSRTIYARIAPNQQSAPTGLYTSLFSGAQVTFNYTSYLILVTPPACPTVTQNPTSPQFTVQANVLPNCRVTAQNINFGSHGVLDSAVDAGGGLGITCTGGTAYSVGLNNGQTGTGPTARRMTLGNQAITYGLYKDSARSVPWGNSGGQLVTGSGAGAVQNIPVYGRVPAQQTPRAGVYTDTVVVTVTY